MPVLFDGETNGLQWHTMARSTKPKKEPAEPKGPSTSAKPEQKRGR